VRLRSVVLVGAVVAATLSAGAAPGLASTALASTALASTGRAGSAQANAGATAASLGLSASASGVPEAAVIGNKNSLDYFTKLHGKWKRTQVAGRNSAFSAPSVVSGPGTDAAIAVEGANHSLVLYIKDSGHWIHDQVAGRNSTYSAPSLVVDPSGGGAIAAEGKNHSLWFRWLTTTGRWDVKEILGNGRDYSAPSLVIRGTGQAGGLGGAGQADIAYQGPDNALAYAYSTSSYRAWVNDVIGAKRAYSAPSLVVLGGTDATPGEAFIAVEGARNSLWTYYDATTTTVFTAHEVLSNRWAYSAPAAVQNGLDPNHAIEIAYRGASDSLGILLSPDGTSWQNDPLGHDGGVDSAPALVSQPNNGQLDLIYQGGSDTLWYLSAPVPSTDIAPAFTASKIGGKGSAYGG
jgi:hypothetical protein